MANVVIVTRQCYLLCEAINYIVINEVEDDEPEYKISHSKKAKKKIPVSMKLKTEYIKERKPYQIVIDFVPIGSPTVLNNNSLKRSSSNEDSTRVCITVQGLERAVLLFQDMVAQIREQLPDQMFLDKLVEKFLTGQT